MNKRAIESVLFYLIGLFGVTCLIYLGLIIFLRDKEVMDFHNWPKLIFYTALFLVFFDSSATLPSGARWKPVMVLVLAGTVMFPPYISFIVMIPGVLVSSIRRKDKVWNFFTTTGHLAAGMLAGGSVFYYAFGEVQVTSKKAQIALVCALVAHFLVNRILAVIILTFRKRSNFNLNLLAIYRDINWSYLCIYSLGMIMALIDHVYSYLGSITALIALVSVFKAMGYYQKYKMISKTAFIDALTQAENRAAWEVFKDELNPDNRPGTLAMIDLDDFKLMNDTYGHAEGDAVLREFVEHIRLSVQRDHRVFRYGGDEFVLYLPHDPGESAHVYKQIEQILNKLNGIWKRRDLPVSVSFGFAQINDPSEIDQSIEKADQLMYREKQAKKVL